MNNVLGLIMENAIILEIGLFGVTAEGVLLVTLFGRKKYSWVIFLLGYLWWAICDIGVMILLNEIYGAYPWFPALRAVLTNACTLFLMLVTPVLWKVKLSKFLIAFLLANYVSGMFWFIPLQFPVSTGAGFLIGTTAFVLVYRLTYPLLIKYRTYELRHPIIMTDLVFLYLVNSVLVYFFYEDADSVFNSSGRTFQGNFLYILISLFIILCGIIYYSVQNVRTHRRLLKDRKKLEEQYGRVRREITEIQEFKEQSDTRMAGISARLQKSAADTESLKQYLSELKEHYDALGRIFYCDDYIVDGVLTDFALSCQEEQIKTDILFQNFDRSGIQTEDILGILFLLTDYGKSWVRKPEEKSEREFKRESEGKSEKAAGGTLEKAPGNTAGEAPGNTAEKAPGNTTENVEQKSCSEISLHGGVVKNQLILSMCAKCAKRTDHPEKQHGGFLCKRRRERQLRKYLRKYNGSISITDQNGELQLITGMERKR